MFLDDEEIFSVPGKRAMALVTHASWGKPPFFFSPTCFSVLGGALVSQLFLLLDAPFFPFFFFSFSFSWGRAPVP